MLQQLASDKTIRLVIRAASSGDFTPIAIFSICLLNAVVDTRESNTGHKIDNRNFITSSGQIWLDDVRCTGTETNIAECSHGGWGVHNCQHPEDVAIRCDTGMLT